MILQKVKQEQEVFAPFHNDCQLEHVCVCVKSAVAFRSEKEPLKLTLIGLLTKEVDRKKADLFETREEDVERAEKRKMRSMNSG